MQSSASSTSSSCSVKIEPYSPPQSRTGNSSSTGNSFPPSPSGSESSDNFASHFSPEVVFSSNNVNNIASPFTTPRRSDDVVTMLDISTPPVSPHSVTVGPQQMTLSNVNASPSNALTSNVTFASSNITLQPTIATSPNVIKISGFQCVTLPQTTLTVQSAPITTASIINVKVPIPKITKPGLNFKL